MTMDAVRASFERQWRARVDAGPDLSYYVLRPDHLKSNTWLVLVFGWIFNPEQGRATALEFFRLGFPMILIDSPTGIAASGPWSFTLLRAYFRRGAAIVKALQLARETEGIESVSFVTHADGSIAAACAATLLHRLFGRLGPVRVRKIIMVEPAGVIHPDNPLALWLRTNQERRRDAAEHARNPYAFSDWWPKPDPRRGTFYHWWGQYGENLFWTLFQALSMAWIDLPKLLRPLKAAGVSTGAVVGTRSVVFPLDRVRRGFHGWADRILPVDGAGNWSLLIDPEEVVEAVSEVESML